MDRVIAALQRKLAHESEDAFHRGMHFPTRWDPFFKDYMSLEDGYRYPGQQLRLPQTATQPQLRRRLISGREWHATPPPPTRILRNNDWAWQNSGAAHRVTRRPEQHG